LDVKGTITETFPEHIYHSKVIVFPLDELRAPFESFLKATRRRLSFGRDNIRYCG